MQPMIDVTRVTGNKKIARHKIWRAFLRRRRRSIDMRCRVESRNTYKSGRVESPSAIPFKDNFKLLITMNLHDTIPDAASVAGRVYDQRGSLLGALRPTQLA